jgi:cell fate regulator YaaT (PSP1 superfamily)
VGTAAARFQDLSLNPQKLAGQCAKLKCCMNYEVDQYVESLRRLPSREITLQTQDAEYFFFKADILAHRITYSTDKKFLANEQTISARRAFEVMQMNKNGHKPASLTEEQEEPESTSNDLVEQESINRFDSRNQKRKKGGSGKKKHGRGNGNGNGNKEKQS